MDEEFVKTANIIRRIVRECPWGKEQDLGEHIKKLSGEVEELKEAFETKNLEEIKDELGDVFYDALFLLILAEKDYKINIEEVIRTVRKKIERRKPYLFEDMKVETKEEALKIWNEIKMKEKEMGLR